jgi:hypothetical protein
VAMSRIPGHDRDGVGTGAKVPGGPEGARPVAQQHADVIGTIRGRQVEVAVAVEVARRNRRRTRIDGDVGGRLEGPVAGAQQHAGAAFEVAGDPVPVAPAVAGVPVAPAVAGSALREETGVIGRRGRHEVEVAVLVEVAHRHGGRLLNSAAERLGVGDRKRAIAVAQQHVDAAFGVAGGAGSAGGAGVIDVGGVRRGPIPAGAGGLCIGVIAGVMTQWPGVPGVPGVPGK